MSDRTVQDMKLAFATSGGPSDAAGSTQDKSDSFYKVTETNWYKTLPYGFAFFDRKSKGDQKVGYSGSTIFYLPISPSNINVTTHFATNVVTTLYGVVEEHSEVRYYDIVISGTTGMTPIFNKERNNNSKDSVKNNIGSPDSVNTSKIVNPLGRTAFQNSSIDLGGFLPEVTNVISQVKNSVSEIGDFLSNGPKNYTGVTPYQNGYMAFHNFYRFLLKYKLDTAGRGVMVLLSELVLVTHYNS